MHQYGSEIGQVGLDGYHAHDRSWCDSQHEACVDIVDAVLNGLSEAGYVITRAEQPEVSRRSTD